MTMNGNRTALASGSFTGGHFLAILLVTFGIVFAVNGYFIYEAIATFDGIEVNDAYQKGRAYNKVIDAMSAQKARGWRSTVDIRPSSAPQTTHLALTFVDRNGDPLDALKVSATFWRPVVGGEDRKQAMIETVPGRYEAEFHLPHDGNWIVRVAALGTGGETFVEETRVFVKAN